MGRGPAAGLRAAYLVRFASALRRPQALSWGIRWRGVQRMEGLWTTIAQCLMRPFRVIPVNPCADRVLRLGKCPKRLLPDALLFQRSEPPFNHAILLGRVGRNKFLLQPIQPTGLPKATALEDQAVITTDDGNITMWLERPKPR